VSTYSIIGTRGGIGTSTFAWAFAQEISAYALLDFSEHQGVAWTTGKSNLDLSWPSALSSQISEPLFGEILEKTIEVSGIKVLSGGEPIKSENFSNSLNYVVDGDFDTDFQILHTTNSVQDLQINWKLSSKSVVVVRQVEDGVPLKLIEKKFDYAYRSERSVKKSIRSGFGLHHKSQVRNVAKEIYADFCRDTSVAH
jgi:hypothetical protein